MLTCEVPIFNKNVQLWKSYSIFSCKFCALFLLCVHLWLCSTSNHQYVTPSSSVLITELFFLNDLIGEKIMQEWITSRPFKFKTKAHYYRVLKCILLLQITIKVFLRPLFSYDFLCTTWNLYRCNATVGKQGFNSILTAIYLLSLPFNKTKI